jgi:ABC-type Fe3+-hydroxamate transport system substrate-binding protein
VGRSHECDFPPGLEGLPVLTSARTPPGAAPGQIDQAVREQLAQGAALYTLNADLLASLRPDLILTQDLCSVCSIDLAAVRGLVVRLDPVPAILSLNPTSVEDVLDDLLRVGQAAGRIQEAAAALVHLRERLVHAADFVNPYQDGPRVAFLEWTDPLFVGGHWTPQLVERAGGTHPLNPTVPAPRAGAGVGPQQASRMAGPSVRISPEALVASRPDALVICPCGVPLTEARGMAADLARAPWWRDLPAARAGRVAIVDGVQMFNRPGPRLVDAFEWLVGWLNERPALIPRGFPWEPWTR